MRFSSVPKAALAACSVPAIYGYNVDALLAVTKYHHRVDFAMHARRAVALPPGQHGIPSGAGVGLT